MFEGYRDLVAWQKGMDLAARVYEVATNLPGEERFGLTSQLRRASVSIPSSLAEGHARASTKEFAYYVPIAMGSVAELETQLLLAVRLGYITEISVRPLLVECNEQGRILRGLKKSLDSKISAKRKPSTIAQTLAHRPSP